MKISSLNGNTTLCNHITCYRTVDTTGQKQHCFSGCSNRHTARSRNDHGINIYLRTNFHVQHDIRVMYVNFHLRISVQNDLTKICIDLLGVFREVFPCSSGNYFESLIFIRIYVIQIFQYVFCQLVKTVLIYSD